MREHQRPILASELCGILKNRIVRWQYLPGHRFTEEEICKEFGVSRSPVREALRMLEEHGLVDKVPYRGCSVRQPDIQAITELYDVRAILELAVVARLAAEGLPPEVLEGLTRHWGTLARVTLFSEVQALDLANEDRAFHEALASATGNRTLLDML